MTPAFLAALQSPVHTIDITAYVLDSNFNPVPGGVFHAQECGCAENSIHHAMIDGSVDVDISRTTRRTFQMNVVNEDSAFSPTSNWAGLFYVNRLVRIFRGVQYNDGNSELVPVGTFMLDNPTVVVERNMSIVTLAGSDLWKKFVLSKYTTPVSFPVGTSLNSIITQMATEAGVTNLNLDPLSTRTSQSANIQAVVSFIKGDNRGDKLSQLCAAHGIDIFFDPMGVLTTREFQDPMSRGVSLDYTADAKSTILSIQAEYSDAALYNHVFVTGTGNPNQTYTSELMDNDPSSPTNINAIGDREYTLETQLLASQAAVDKAAATLFYNVMAVSENITLQAICNPAIDANDVVTVTETQYAKLTANKYLINAFSIPLDTSKQQVKLQRVIQVG